MKKISSKNSSTKAKGSKPRSKKNLRPKKTATKKTATKKTATKKTATKKTATKKTAAKKTAAKKTAAKKTAAKKTAAKKTAAKKTAAKKTAAKKTAAKKTAAKKTAAKKTAAKKTTAKKTAAKKTAAKKTAAKKTAAKKTAAKKTAAKKTAAKKTAAKKTAAKKTAAKKTAAKKAKASSSKSKRTQPGRVTENKKTTTKQLSLPLPPKIKGPVTIPKLVALGREVLGIEELRPGQKQALGHILKKRDTLAVMPTGAGKSLLYQLPSLVLPGITVVVSPLIALIKDQIDKMKQRGVAVCRVDSTLTIKQRREMEALAVAPGGKLLLTTPERMADQDFRDLLREGAGSVGVSLFVVDEAHCVSQWGHDFRPSYLAMRKSLEDLGRPPVLATTATAPPHVREDILHQLGAPDAKIVTTTFDRPNLHYEVIALPGDDEKLKTLVTLLKKLPRPGIIYCATVKKVNSLHEALSRHGIPVAKYHGRLTKKDRTEQQQRFMAPRSGLVMIATNAFGLGVDKSDIRYVLHYHVPGSLEAYAQEAGRGGRDQKPARCVLLFSPDDIAIQEYFLTGTYPTRRQVRAVYNALKAWSTHEESPPTIANLAISAHVGAQRTRTVLSLLKDEQFVEEHEDNSFSLTDPPPDEKLLNDKAKQYEARRVADRQRLDALLEYVRTPGCRSQVILRYLGETNPPLCERCDNCLRSKEAAEAAAQRATRLEESLTWQLDSEDTFEESNGRSNRIIRHRVIRIDEDPELLLAEAAEVEEGEEEEEQDFVEDIPIEVIDKTAAALAEEGVDLGDAEITILARKKDREKNSKHTAPSIDAAEPGKKRKRRRRKRKRRNVIPPKSAFSSPVLAKPSKNTGKRSSRNDSPAGPLVEYVRGPMRINMRPVASATPNDVQAPTRRSKKRNATTKTNKMAPVGNNGIRNEQKTDTRPPGEEKRRRRRRRRRKRAAGDAPPQNHRTQVPDGPVQVFSPTGSNGGSTSGKPNGNGKRRRRRRKRNFRPPQNDPPAAPQGSS